MARLDVVATYYEFDPNEPVMHVLARTPSEPYRYHYRQWVDERRWTPWELVDLEIDSQHVLLFKRGGRLYLGWMTAKQEQDRPRMPDKFTTQKNGDNYTVSGSKSQGFGGSCSSQQVSGRRKDGRRSARAQGKLTGRRSR